MFYRWACVEVSKGREVATGGVYQLKVGQQRRVRVAVTVPATTTGGTCERAGESMKGWSQARCLLSWSVCSLC